MTIITMNIVQLINNNLALRQLLLVLQSQLSPSALLHRLAVPSPILPLAPVSVLLAAVETVSATPLIAPTTSARLPTRSAMISPG